METPVLASRLSLLSLSAYARLIFRVRFPILALSWNSPLLVPRPLSVRFGSRVTERFFFESVYIVISSIMSRLFFNPSGNLLIMVYLAKQQTRKKYFQATKLLFICLLSLIHLSFDKWD